MQNFARLNAADEVESRRRPKERIRLLDQRIALLFLQSHIQDCNAGTAYAERPLHVERAHLRKLHKMRCLRVDIGARIQKQSGAAVFGRNEGRKRRALHTGQPTDQHLTADQYRTAVTGGNKGIRSFLAYQLHADHQR